MSSAASNSNLSLPVTLSTRSTRSSSMSAGMARTDPAALPPGPRASLWSAHALTFRPIQALAEWRKQFGPTFTVNRLGTQIVFTAEPDLIHQLYAANDPELFASAVPEAVDVLLGRRSVLAASGARHQQDRKLMMPPFHGERMRGWAEAMADASRRAFARTGETRALERTQEATLEVIIRVIFGVDDEQRICEFQDALTAMMNRVRPGFLFTRKLQRDMFGLLPYARYRRASERVDALLLDQITRTRANLDGRTDVLADLLRARYDDGSAMDDATICDQLRTLLIAGHETTAVILAWAIYFILRDDDVLAHVRNELAALDPNAGPEQLARLPYLGAVIDETLRMRPVTTDTFRLLTRPWQFGKWLIPAGTAISASALLVHSDPELWPEPEAFQPDRFLHDRPRPNVYMPFGGGTRRCLGATFARFEACVMLGTLLREQPVELLERDVEWVRGPATLQPRGGVRIRVG
jgi:cytochrome P450 family 110